MSAPGPGRGDAKHIEIGLTDKSDSARRVPEGVSIRANAGS